MGYSSLWLKLFPLFFPLKTFYRKFPVWMRTVSSRYSESEKHIPKEIFPHSRHNVTYEDKRRGEHNSVLAVNVYVTVTSNSLL